MGLVPRSSASRRSINFVNTSWLCREVVYFIDIMKHMTLILLVLVFLNSCKNGNEEADAYGNFEAREYLIPAQVQGNILALDLREGMRLEQGQEVGLIDTIPYHLQKKQLTASRGAARAKLLNLKQQVEVQTREKENLQREITRTKALLDADAATQKQLDDLQGKLNVLESRIEATRGQGLTIRQQIRSIWAQIEQARDQLDRCHIINPVKGNVLETYLEAHELAIPGRTIYKLADLDEMILRVYISGAQLPHLKINQEVEVYFDLNEKENQRTSGIVTWISDEAEFTPKIIQTKEERVKLVYAVKVRVKNDGRIKIGMPGEIKF